MRVWRLGRSLLSALAVILALSAAPPSESGRAASNLQVLAVVGGQPDDIAVDSHGRLVWGDLQHGTIDRLQGGRVVTVASGISVPEGIVPTKNGSLIVAEQGRDRIIRIAPGGHVTVIDTLQPVAGQEGVDGIGRYPPSGDLLIPDSPHGTVLLFNLRTGKSRILAGGLGRPVDAAVDAHGNVLVPDEHLGTLVVISPHRRVTHRGSFSTPDDVAVDRHGDVWVTSLGDGGLWLLAPGKGPKQILSGLGNPQGLTLDRCGDPIVVDQNTARIVRLLRSDSSRSCAP